MTSHPFTSMVDAQAAAYPGKARSTNGAQLCRMNKDIRMNLDVSKRFSATDYLQARTQHLSQVFHDSGAFQMPTASAWFAH